MLLNKITDSFETFKISWGSAGLLTLSAPKLDVFFPIITQICLIAGVQMVSIIVDLVRKKMKLKEKEINLDELIKKNIEEFNKKE